MVEILIVLTILAVIAVMTVPRVVATLGLTDRATAREQGKSIEHALQAWLINEPSVGRAYQDFDPIAGSAPGITIPKKLEVFVELIKPYLSTESATQIKIGTSPDGAACITTAAMTASSSYVVISWNTSYMNNPPKANFVMP